MDTRADKALTLTYHRAADRRSSFIEISDPQSNEKPIIAVPMGVLGKGSHGIVRKFGYHSTFFAVKKPHQALNVCLTSNSISDTMSALDIEMEFMRTAYPDGTYDIKKFLDSETKLDYRLIMPFVTGLTTYKATEALADPQTFAYIVLNIFLELQRIHDLNLVHGDAAPGNIIIDPDRLTAHFIDGAFSCQIGKKITVFAMKNTEESYMPPERLNVNECEAHTAQDIYTVCWTIDYLMKRRKNLHPYFGDIGNDFPCIPAFIAKGLNKNPAERPALKALIEELQPLLVMEHIKRQLLSHPPEDAQRILTEYQAQASVEKLLRLSYELMQLEKYDLLHASLNFIESLTPDQKSIEMIKLYRYISAKKAAADVAWKNSQSLFGSGRNILGILDQLGDALSLCKAVNFPDCALNADVVASIKAAPQLFEIYNNLIANGAHIKLAPPRGTIQHI